MICCSEPPNAEVISDRHHVIIVAIIIVIIITARLSSPSYARLPVVVIVIVASPSIARVSPWARPPVHLSGRPYAALTPATSAPARPPLIILILTGHAQQQPTTPTSTSSS